MKRISLSLVFLVVLVCLAVNLSLAPLAAIDSEPEIVHMTLYCEDKAVGLSQIVVGIYTSENVPAESDDFFEYDEMFHSECFLNEDGSLSFDRPSEFFSASVRLDTLPNGYGISQATYFFEPGCNVFYASICRIDSLIAEKRADEYIFDFRDAKGYPLAVLVDDYELLERQYEINETEQSITIVENLNVFAAGEIFSCQYEETAEYSDEIEKYTILYEKEFLTEREYLNTACAVYLQGECENSGIDAAVLCSQIDAFCESNTLSDSEDENIWSTIDYFSETDSFATTYSASWIYSDNLMFRVDFDTSDVNRLVALAVANEFEEADELFCEEWGMRRPSSQDSSFYLVEIADIGSPSVTYGNSAGYSSIVVDVDWANYIYQSSLGDSSSDKYTGTVAHEYMHAILYGYGLIGEGQPHWMHECFANWAGCVYEESYSEYRESAVNAFLKTCAYPIDAFSSETGNILLGREYGSCLFSMYIYQEMGGYETIKKIFELYGATKDPFAAISEGLTYYGYTFENAVAGCWTYGYAPKYFYDLAADGWKAHYNETVEGKDYPFALETVNGI